jgi:hypothetical protein
MPDRITPSEKPGHGAAEYNVTLHINEAKMWLQQLTDEQRLEAFAMLVDGWCRYCGRQIHGLCHCINDE